MKRPIVGRRSVVLSFSFLFLPGRVGCAPMPITPPDPGDILDKLRAVQEQLRALAQAQPDAPFVKVALGSVDVAVVAAEALEREAEPRGT